MDEVKHDAVEPDRSPSPPYAPIFSLTTLDSHEKEIKLKKKQSSNLHPDSMIRTRHNMYNMYIPQEGPVGNFIGALIHELPHGESLRKLTDKLRYDLKIPGLPVLFATDVAWRVMPELFCQWCKVDLWTWETFHGDVIETQYLSVRVCSSYCLAQTSANSGAFYQITEDVDSAAEEETDEEHEQFLMDWNFGVHADEERKEFDED